MDKYNNFEEALQDFEAFMQDSNDGVKIAPVIMEGYKPSVFNGLSIKASQILRNAEVQAVGFGISFALVHLLATIPEILSSTPLIK